MEPDALLNLLTSREMAGKLVEAIGNPALGAT